MPHSLACTISRVLIVLLYLGYISFCCNASKPKYVWPTMSTSNQHHQKTSSSQDDDFCPTKCQCKFFVWDFIAYCKYKETIYQVRQNTIEGLGGKKFVRIQPNSLLEKWYPQLRAGVLKPDRCCACGYSWKDHLQFWWYYKQKKGRVSKQFDSYMDHSALKQGEKSFTRYVQEVDNTLKHRSTIKGKEVRKSFEGEVSYLVTPFDPSKINSDGPKSVGSVLLLALARIQAMVKIEDLIFLNRVQSFRSEKDTRRSL